MWLNEILVLVVFFAYELRKQALCGENDWQTCW